jgi:Uma2 family endonuclease
MTVMVEIPRDSKPRGAQNWTVADLENLPDDGRRYELLDGRLVVSPAPTVKHQRAARGVFRVLDATRPPGLEAVFAPVDWQPERTTSFQPDVLVIRDVGPEAKNVTSGLVLAVEVLSPSTRHLDLGPKRARYESAGVGSYWVVDPDEPSVRVWNLVDGHYQVGGVAEGDQKLEVTTPFPVTLSPSALLRS